jgi:hypothetical protein
MPRIEIDQDILDYLRSRVQDFGETPNSVLRRELGLASHAERTPAKLARNSSTPSTADAPTLTSFGAPEALRQILRVVWLVRVEGLDRIQATVRAADEFGVERTTIADKYGRQLGLDVPRFDRLIGEPDLSELRRLLLSKFSDHRPDVADAMQRIVDAARA